MLYETSVRFDDPSDAVKKATDAMKTDPRLSTCNRCGRELAL